MALIKDTSNSSSFLQTEEGMSQIASGPNSVTSTNTQGNFINGSVSFSSPPESIKIGGVFRLNPLLATGIPSTLVTPIPTLILDLPLKNISAMVAISTIVASLL